MAKKVEAPIYWRNGRAYLDARSYSDVGGSQERLVPPGEKVATKDAVVARELAAQRVRELESLRRDKVLHGITRRTELAPFAAYHLEKKAESETVTDQWLESVEMHLRTALEFFGDCDIHTIGVVGVQEYASYLTTIRSRGKPLGPGSRRKYLNSLSNLFRRAAAEGYVLPGYNPVAALMEKPQDKQSEAEWLEVYEAALLLEAARLYIPARGEAIPPQMLYTIVATYLLTGGREDEILGLLVTDISFERGTVTIRTNRWRRLKTRNAPRTLPLWPQLEQILRPYIFDRDEPLGELLFPSPRGVEEAMITDLRKALDAAALPAGFAKGKIRTKVLRHTYCSARLQTLDGGAPVSEFTVAKEMGHGGFSLVRNIYGHLGRIRHRSDVVEYHVAQHRDLLEQRIERLREVRVNGGPRE